MFVELGAMGYNYVTPVGTDDIFFLMSQNSLTLTGFYLQNFGAVTRLDTNAIPLMSQNNLSVKPLFAELLGYVSLVWVPNIVNFLGISGLPTVFNK